MCYSTKISQPKLPTLPYLGSSDTPPVLTLTYQLRGNRVAANVTISVVGTPGTTTLFFFLQILSA